MSAQVEKCSLKLDRAQELISGLGGEKERWMEAAHALRGQFGGILGDMLVSVVCRPLILFFYFFGLARAAWAC